VNQALEDDKTLINLQLDAFKLWIEIGDKEPTLEQNNTIMDLGTKLMDAEAKVDTCPFKEFNDQVHLITINSRPNSKPRLLLF
jgi:hypothetical protein